MDRVASRGRAARVDPVVEWAAAQLKDMAASELVTVIERDLLRHLPDGTFYFPAVTDDQYPSPLHPLSAYVFVDGVLPDTKILRLQRSRFIETVLRLGRGVARVPEPELRRTLRTPVVPAQTALGRPAIILAGDFSGLEGHIADTLDDGRLAILVELRSISHVVKLLPHEIQVL